MMGTERHLDRVDPAGNSGPADIRLAATRTSTSRSVTDRASTAGGRNTGNPVTGSLPSWYSPAGPDNLRAS